MQFDDIEAFLNALPANRRRRLSGVRQFFGCARRNKLVLGDPTTTVTVPPGPSQHPQPAPHRHQDHQAPHDRRIVGLPHPHPRRRRCRVKTLRSTRLVDLLISLDPKLVAEALGTNADGLLDYLADGVDPDPLHATNL